MDLRNFGLGVVLVGVGQRFQEVVVSLMGCASALVWQGQVWCTHLLNCLLAVVRTRRDTRFAAVKVRLAVVGIHPVVPDFGFVVVVNSTRPDSNYQLAVARSETI